MALITRILSEIMKVILLLDTELLTSSLSGLLQEVQQYAGRLVHAQLLCVLTACL